MVNKRNLFLALLCSSIAALLAYQYISNLEKGLMADMEMVQVIVANKRIGMGDVIEEPWVHIQEIPVCYRIENAAATINEVVGKYADVEIFPGEQIILERLSLREPPKASGHYLKEGLRAIMLSLPEEDRLEGLLEPGDRVDIIGVLRTRDGGDMSFTFMQDVQVLLVGGKASGFETNDLEYMSYPSSTYNVVLAVTPVDAQRLAFLREYGRLRLSLRSKGDGRQIEDLERTDMTSLFEEQESDKKDVQVIRGTEVEEVHINLREPFPLNEYMFKEIIH